MSRIVWSGLVSASLISAFACTSSRALAQQPDEWHVAYDQARRLNTDVRDLLAGSVAKNYYVALPTSRPPGGVGPDLPVLLPRVQTLINEYRQLWDELSSNTRAQINELLWNDILFSELIEEQGRKVPDQGRIDWLRAELEASRLSLEALQRREDAIRARLTAILGELGDLWVLIGRLYPLPSEPVATFPPPGAG